MRRKSLNKKKELGLLTSTEVSVLVTPEMGNFYGTMHGGELLKRLDNVAYICGVRYCKNQVVTLAVDNVLFKEPVYIGELLTIQACVNYTGKTSMEIGIKVMAENLKTLSMRHTTSCYFTMVAVDDKGGTMLVPELLVNGKVAQRRHENAILRNKNRKKLSH